MFFLELVMQLDYIRDVAMLDMKEKKKISETRVNFVKSSGTVTFFMRYIAEQGCNKLWEQL